MANTYKALQTATVGAGGAASVIFNNIPQNYTDLVVKWSVRLTDTNFDLTVDYNGSNSSLTARTLYTTNGTTVTSEATNFAYYWVNASGTTANTFSNGELYMPNYVASINKSFSIDMVVENNETAARLALEAGLRSNTDPITSIRFAPNAGSIAQYSTFTLYGVFNADVSSPPAAPTIGTATAGIESASVTFTGVANAASYTATSTPGGLTTTGTASPLVVTGLAGGTAYTFTVSANNPLGSSTSAASNSITALYPAYDSIASTLVGAGGTGSITFNSIPSGYTHLQLRFVGRSLASAPNDSILIRYNSDSGTNYVIHRLYGEATGPSGSQGFTSQTYTIAGDMPAATASLSQTVGTSVVDILDYSNTNKNKTTRVSSGRNENGVGYIWLNSSLWLNTAAISSITVLAGNGSLAQYTRASLYGIKGA
jgi:hypothetical protein